MPPTKTPTLALGGRNLWRAVTADHVLDAAQEVTLLEACRAKDRLDELDQVLRGDVDTWVSLVHDPRTHDHELKVNVALASANITATLLKQLLASLRLPDAAGRRGQRRGGARGAYLVGKARGYWISRNPT
jgi:hypothetical protein